MSTRRVRMALWLTAIVLASPAAVSAQSSRVGFVMTMEGDVAVSRLAPTRLDRLAPHDDVSVNDRINLGDAAFVQLSLGRDKAVLAIRERSTITITEVPGKSTINVEAGAAALIVDTTKVRPGELLELRTPNASLGLMGTLSGSGERDNIAIAELGGAGTCHMTSKFTVLGGMGSVTAPDPATGRWIELQAMLMPWESVMVSACTGPGKIGAVSRAEVDALTVSYRIEPTQ